MTNSQVNTRYWGFRNATKGADPAKPEVTLCPLLDMSDHAEVLEFRLQGSMFRVPTAGRVRPSQGTALKCLTYTLYMKNCDSCVHDGCHDLSLIACCLMRRGFPALAACRTAARQPFMPWWTAESGAICGHADVSLAGVNTHTRRLWLMPRCCVCSRAHSVCMAISALQVLLHHVIDQSARSASFAWWDHPVHATSADGPSSGNRRPSNGGSPCATAAHCVALHATGWLRVQRAT